MADVAVRGVLESNTTLSGLFTTPDGVVLADGNWVLAAGQTANTQNGIWVARAGAWERVFESGFDYRPGMEVRVLEGTNNALVLWLQTAAGPIVEGTSSMTWRKESLGRLYVGEGGIQVDGNTIRLLPSGVSAGIYETPTLTILEDGRIGVAAGASLVTSFIEGLQLTYLSTTQVQVKTGSAYIPGVNRRIVLQSTSTTTVQSGANAITYLYLYETNGVGQIESSPTAPLAPYSMYSRTKTGDSSRRFIGMLRNDSLGNLIPFNMELLGSGMHRMNYTPADFTQVRFVNAYTGSTTAQVVSIARDAPTVANRLVGPSAESIFLFWITTGSSFSSVGYNPAATGTPPTSLRAGTRGENWVDLSPAQEMYYKLAATTDTISLYVQGYLGRR